MIIHYGSWGRSGKVISCNFPLEKIDSMTLNPFLVNCEDCFKEEKEEWRMNWVEYLRLKKFVKSLIESGEKIFLINE